jgi:hypothetical protein
LPRQNYDLALPGRYSVKYSTAHPQPGGGFLEVVSDDVRFDEVRFMVTAETFKVTVC